MVAICMASLSCGKNPEISTKPTTDSLIIGGRWKINVDDDLDVRYYSFYEEGVYSCYYSTRLKYDESGIYSLKGDKIIINGEEGIIDELTVNSLKFQLNGVFYNGERIEHPDPKVREKNKALLIGEWSCVVTDYRSKESSVMTLNENGTYTHVYNNEYGQKYSGHYYVLEKRVFFDEPKGKDPISDELELKGLTQKSFVMSGYYDEKIEAKKE